MSKYGVEFDFIDLTDISLMEKTIKPNTKVSLINYPVQCRGPDNQTMLYPYRR